VTWETVVRFVPAYDTRHLVGDVVNAPALLVTADAVNRMRSDKPTPVVIDHDEQRVIGRVKSVYVWDDCDYGTRVRKWHFAACELDERPDWLKRGSGASWSYHPLHTYAAGNDADTEILTSCIVREISLLSPAETPREPLARVAYVKELPVTHRHHAKPEEGEVIPGHGAMIRRPNIGQVLSVGGIPVR